MTMIAGYDVPDDRMRFSVKEVAFILGVSFTTVGRYLDIYADTRGQEGGLRFVQLIAGGQRFVNREDLVTFITRKPWEPPSPLDPPFDSNLVEWPDK